MTEERLAHYLTPHQAGEALAQQCAATGSTEFVRIRNLDYVFSPYDVVPLAPHAQRPLPHITAITVDMDGTSTTTEPLALHALEYMVRRFTGLSEAEWSGLDPVRDHPYVIGNSNFRHTEFLVQRYRDDLDSKALRTAFFEALVWTLSNMDDARRLRDIQLHARHCGLTELFGDRAFQRLIGERSMATERVREQVRPLLEQYGAAFACPHEGALVAAALDVYYFRYHAILRGLEAGHGQRLCRELLGDASRHLVAPMPGYAIFVALIKGWLGAEAEKVFELLAALRPVATPPPHKPSLAQLAALGRHFEMHPVKVALVTASIGYEAHASMREVIRVAAEEARAWPVSAACADRVQQGLSDYRAIFDAFICASDACEHRLKPHRDLYSLALHQMAVPPAEYPYCVGLEDTEPGIIALRAAGIGSAVALPNRDTANQDYSAATLVVPGGLPEFILSHRLLFADA